MSRARWTRVLTLIFVLALSSRLATAQRTDDARERSFIASVAATVYGVAWPSATYKDWRVKSVERQAGGLDVVVRLSGESMFGGELWLDLVFKFRNGGFSDLGLREHNAILVPPFETAKTIGAVARDLINDAANNRPAPAPATAPRAYIPPPTPPLYAIGAVSKCAYPASLWVRILDSSGTWRNYGSWSLKGNSRIVLGDIAGTALRASSSNAYFYAEVHDRSYTWGGSDNVSFGERTLPMRPIPLSASGPGELELSLACANYTPPKPITYLVGIRGRDFKASETAASTGALVAGIMNGFPGEAAGLQVNDVITAIDGQAIAGMTRMQELVRAAGPRPLKLTVTRGSAERAFTLTPSPALHRQPLDYDQCRANGNPPDYFVGAVAVPFKSPSGEFVTPLYPGTTGRLFDPDEVDIYVRLPSATDSTTASFIFHGKPLRDDIVGFEYLDADRAMRVRLASGERLDLGVRIQCLVQPGIMKATEVRLSRTKDHKEISFKMLPLQLVQ
jgi:hypothetical protein